MKSGYVYILTNKPNGTLYIGVTANLANRIDQHRQKVVKGFSAKYNLDKLIYVEIYDDLSEARLREVRMKKWKRQWKVELIEATNPAWKDLSHTL